MLANLAKTVVLTGSILPFGEPHSDARRNIIVSTLIAGSRGVWSALGADPSCGQVSVISLRYASSLTLTCSEGVVP